MYLLPFKPIIKYHEKKIGKTLYRVTSVHKCEVDLAKTLEDLTVRRVLSCESSTGYGR
ncbi:MAG: hypothetical protein FWE19_03405 [Oscillospiraceae bacterium]|nr:hypothetical protein [Oscillospiraceae bacterium]